jgi:hypothetical protein
LRHTRGTNLQEPLIQYRVHETSITSTRLAEQTRISSAISARQIAELAPHLPLTTGEVDRLRCWTAEFPKRLAPADLPLCRKFLEILQTFEASEGVDVDVVNRIRKCWHDRVRDSVNEPAWLELTVPQMSLNRSY